MKKYTGRCHCGDIRFSFASAEITTGVRCNCSLCMRRGAVLSAHYVSTPDFVLQVDPARVGRYLWNDRVVDSYFCKHCGIFTHVGSVEYGYRINLGCVDGLDPFTLPIRLVDGRSMPVADEPGSWPGETAP